MPHEPLGARAENSRHIEKAMNEIDALTLHVAEVFGILGELPTITYRYKDLIGNLEQSLQAYVEAADALTYELQQDREKGRW